MVEILYCDQNLVVCVKEPGVLSQDADKNSLPKMLREQLNVPYVGVVHRLDKDVGGVMVFALTPNSAAALSKTVQENALDKIYLAAVSGIPDAQEAVLEDLLFHDKTKNKTYVVKRVRKGVKDAKLSYTTLRTSERCSLVRIKLFTGRTHQIRVQFASRKHPLIGDGKYGGKQPGLPLMLWSYRLRFPHPVTREILSFEKEPAWKEQLEFWFT